MYWDPRPAEDAELRESPEHARELRRLLLAALERDLDPHGGNLIALSGGVDSSALAALAAGTLGRPLSSLSLVSDEPTVLERELGYLEPLTRDLGLTPAHRITLDVDALLRYARAPAPTVAPIVHPVLLALPEVAATQEVTILLGGEDADPVVGHRQGLDDWARETPPWRLRWAELPFGPRDYLRWIRARLRGPELLMPAELPPSLHGDVHAEFTELRDGEARRAREDRRPLHQLAARLRQDAWLAMNWEALTPRGICRSVPFQTREVLELAFRCPARERLGPGTKRLLRNALSGDVPSRNLGRQDKASFGRVVGDEPVPIGVDLPPMAAGLVRDELLASPATPRPLSDVLDVLRCLPAARWLQENASR